MISSNVLILTSVDSKEPVQPPFKLRNSKCCSVRSLTLNSHIILKPLAKALIRLCICAGWSEALLVAHATLLEMSCRGSFVTYTQWITKFLSELLVFFTKLENTFSVLFHTMLGGLIIGLSIALWNRQNLEGKLQHKLTVFHQIWLQKAMIQPMYIHVIYGSTLFLPFTYVNCLLSSAYALW